MLLILGLSLPAFGRTQPEADLSTKSVLVLHAFESNVPIFELTDRGIRATLDAGGVNIRNQFFEYLDLARNPGPEHRKLMVEAMRLRYDQRKIDIIITLYPEALRFVLEEGEIVFSHIPIIALYLPIGFEPQKTGRRIIGHSTRLDFLGTLEIALGLVSGAKHVYVVAGAHEVDRKYEDEARRSFKKWEGQLEFRYLSNLPLEEMLETVSTAPPGTIVLLMGFAADVTGKNYTTREVGKQLSQVSKAPVFGLLEVVLGYGIAGGKLVSFEHTGTKAGELALDILRNTRAPENIPPVLAVPSVPMFDWRQLRRWNLSEAALPKGSVIINRELTFWDFKYYIIGGIAVFLAQTLLVIGLLVQRHRKIVAEESLKKSEERYRILVETMTDGLGVQDENGLFTYVNDRFCEMLGYFHGEIIGRPLTEFLDETNQTIVREQMENRRKGDSSPYEIEWRRRDGRKITTLASPKPIFDSKGQFKGSFAVITDITERRRAEREAFDARREMLRMERLSRMGELVASLAHELNQPLAAILSSAQAALRFLQSATPDLDLFRSILQNIVQDDKRAAGVITSLRSMVRREEKEKELLDINEVLRDALALFRAEAIIRNVEIKTGFDDPLPPVSADRIQLQQVVLNLVMNAAEAMSERPPQQRRILLRTQAIDHGVQVTVRDFGPGIDPAKLNDIWQPFFTTKSTGMGMGLSVSGSIIRAHGGRIWAENNPDGGATFAFEIPISEKSGK
jgi:PAS domain S-box-containing protein